MSVAVWRMRVLAVRRGDADGHEHPALRLESAIDREDVHQAAHEEPGAHEQDERQGDFGADEHAAEAVLSAIAGRPARAASECRQDVAERCPKCRDEARQHADRQRRRRRECDHPAVQGDLRQPRNAAGVDRLQHAQHPGRDEPAERGSGEAVDQRFGQPLAYQIRTRRPERRPHGVLAGPGRCAREQKIGHVHARDQEQQTGRPEQHPERPSQLIAGDPHLRRLHRGAEIFVRRVTSPRDPSRRARDPPGRRRRRRRASSGRSRCIPSWCDSRWAGARTARRLPRRRATAIPAAGSR